jgi:ribosomal protein S18 acetylase RimI-like enzyme
MSEEDEALRELAANRGCKLTKSRRRKPGGDFGRYGLKDAKTGREVFGFGDDGLTATSDEIRSFLRGGGASTWRTSLRKALKDPAPAPAPPASARRSEPERAAPPAKGRPVSPPPAPPPPKPPPPEPKLVIREARPRDADALAQLILALGYDVTAPDIRRRLAGLAKAGHQALVAEKGELVGALTTAVTPVLHRPRAVGRISLLVVAEQARGKGIGTALVAEAADRLAGQGCGLLEVTSHMKRLRAHGFYERLGFERTSYRFMKKLAD